MSETGLVERLDEVVAEIRKKAPDGWSPDVGIVLGSGLGAFADRLEGAVAIPYAELPHFPVSKVAGHKGRLVLGRLGSVGVVAMQGRVHYYEGYPLETVVLPIRVLCRLGIGTLAVTNAAGGISEELRPGDLMAITDHINFAGLDPLQGKNDSRLGLRFPDMTTAYNPRLLELLRKCAAEEGLTLREGIYVVQTGPSYETPAEIRALGRLGADAVGMSTVPEVIAAHHMGVEVVGISCITNLAAGRAPKPLSHDEVAEVARQVEDDFCRLLTRLLSSPELRGTPHPVSSAEGVEEAAVGAARASGQGTGGER